MLLRLLHLTSTFSMDSLKNELERLFQINLDALGFYWMEWNLLGGNNDRILTVFTCHLGSLSRLSGSLIVGCLSRLIESLHIQWWLRENPMERIWSFPSRAKTKEPRRKSRTSKFSPFPSFLAFVLGGFEGGLPRWRSGAGRKFELGVKGGQIVELLKRLVSC